MVKIQLQIEKGDYIQIIFYYVYVQINNLKLNTFLTT